MGWLVEIEDGIGLQIVQALQDGRLPALDALAVLLHYVGGGLFFMVVIPLVYWSIDRRLGMRLLFALVVAALVNTTLKAIFQAPRPPDRFDFLLPLVVQGGYGFPSGHVMNTLVVWGYLAIYVGRRWLYVAVAGLVVLMAWARVYVGVHFPQDVVGGVVFGLPLLAVYVVAAARIPPVWGRLRWPAQLATVVLGGIIALLFSYPYEVGLAGVVFGGGLGLIFEARYVRFTVTGTVAQRLLRYTTGIFGVVLLYAGLGLLELDDDLVDWLRYALVGLFAAGLWPWLFCRLGLNTPPTNASVTTTAPQN